MTVAEVLERWPQTVSVFQEFKTACVGCSMAPFDTMVDVAREYNLEISEIMEALGRAVEAA
jgi:hybrid cluster-associated redox disulfide protein